MPRQYIARIGTVLAVSPEPKIPHSKNTFKSSLRTKYRPIAGGRRIQSKIKIPWLNAGVSSFRERSSLANFDMPGKITVDIAIPKTPRANYAILSAKHKMDAADAQ
jgi:hypothetical protein